MLQGMSGIVNAILLWHPTDNPSQYRTLAHNGQINLNLRQLFGTEWPSQRWIQFLSKDAGEPNGEVQPPNIPNLPNAPSDDGMEDDDVLMPLPSDSAHPMSTGSAHPMSTGSAHPMTTGSTRREAVPSSSRPVPSGSTRHEPVSTDSSMASSRSAPRHYPKPFNPPAGWNESLRQRQAVPKSDSERSRTPHPSYSFPPGAQPKSQSLSKALRRPPGRAGSSTDGLPKASGTIPAHAIPVPTGSSRRSSVPSSAPPLPAPNHPPLPYHDSDSDLSPESDNGSLASTVAVDSSQYFQTHARPKQPRFTVPCSKFVPCFMSPQEQEVASQLLYLSEHNAHELASDNHVGTEECLEMEFSYAMSRWVEDAPLLKEDEVLVIYVSKGGKKKIMVEKPMDNLSAADVKRDFALVEKGIRKELASIYELQTFELTARATAQNICSSRWVHKYKVVDGIRVVKSRLVVRGFEDLAHTTDLYASTATRWGQRLICSIAVQHGWRIWMSDVSTAFLRSATYVDQAKSSGEPLRQVCITPPLGSDSYVRELPTCSKYSAMLHVLHLLKPLYGWKDAPKAWKAALEKALRACGGVQSHTDKCLWFWFAQRSEHSKLPDVLECALSTHVDDLKGTGIESVALRIQAALTKAFGALKTVWDCFEHCGIVYFTDKAGSISLCQDHYAKQLILIDNNTLSNMKVDEPLNLDLIAQYQSLLGALSWLTQARTDIAVYTCALQRAAKAPLQEHAVRLNRVVKWCKRKLFALWFHKLRPPCRTIAISDSAFRKEDSRGLAMRGALICIGEDRPDDPGGAVHVLEFYARKQRRVTRSTYSAELNAASDAFEFAKLVALTIAETIRPYSSIRELLSLEETGSFPVPVELIIDAKSVYDSLVAREVKCPAEVSLVMFLAQLKEAMLAHSLRKLWWVDTRDMVADALNKGAISRIALLELANTGRWVLKHKAIGFSESRHVPLISSVRLTQTTDESSYFA